MSEPPPKEPPMHFTNLDYAAALFEQGLQCGAVQVKLMERGCQLREAEAILDELYFRPDSPTANRNLTSRNTSPGNPHRPSNSVPLPSAPPERHPVSPTSRWWDTGDNVRLMGALKTAGGLLGFLCVLLWFSWAIAYVKATVHPKPKDGLSLIAGGGLGFLSLGVALRGWLELWTGLPFSVILGKKFDGVNIKKHEPMHFALLAFGMFTAVGAAFGGFFLLAWASGGSPAELARLIFITLVLWAILFRK